MNKRKTFYILYIIIFLLLICGCDKKNDLDVEDSIEYVNSYFEVEPVFISTNRGDDIGFDIKTLKNYKKIDVEFTILYDFSTTSKETGDVKTKNLKLKVQINEENAKITSYRFQENLSRIPKSEFFSYIHDIKITGYEIEKFEVDNNVSENLSTNLIETITYILENPEKIVEIIDIFFILVFINPGFGIACFFIAKKKRRNKVLWLIMGILFGILALIIIALTKNKIGKINMINNYIDDLVNTLKERKELFDNGKISEKEFLETREEIKKEIIVLQKQKEKL